MEKLKWIFDKDFFCLNFWFRFLLLCAFFDIYKGLFRHSSSIEISNLLNSLDIIAILLEITMLAIICIIILYVLCWFFHGIFHMLTYKLLKQHLLNNSSLKKISSYTIKNHALLTNNRVMHELATQNEKKEDECKRNNDIRISAFILVAFGTYYGYNIPIICEHLSFPPLLTAILCGVFIVIVSCLHCAKNFEITVSDEIYKIINDRKKNTDK